MSGEPSKSEEAENLDCAICLQPCLYRIQLPCTHFFCFLCAKGMAMKQGLCGLCRRPFPDDFLRDPSNYVKGSKHDEESVDKDQYGWFYAGLKGWWQYDERTTADIEKAFTLKLKTVDLLIAGSIYTIDLEGLVQFRANGSSRRRNIKRDRITVTKKGVAGIPQPGQPRMQTRSVTRTLRTSQDQGDGGDDSSGQPGPSNT